MLEESASKQAVSLPRKKHENRSPRPDVCTTEVSAIGMTDSARDELARRKTRDANAYRIRLQNDIEMKQKQRADYEAVNKEQLNGFVIGKEDNSPMKSKKTVGSSGEIINNVFPTEADPWNAVVPHSKTKPRSCPSHAPVAPPPPSLPRKSRVEECADIFVNHNGLTGLCVGTQGTPSEIIAEKAMAKAKYKDQLAIDIKQGKEVSDNIQANLKYLD